MEGKSERKSNAKVSALREIEAEIQKLWRSERVFEEDAPEVFYMNFINVIFNLRYDG